MIGRVIIVLRRTVCDDTDFDDASTTVNHRVNQGSQKKKLENPGIDPDTSRMQSGALPFELIPRLQSVEYWSLNFRRCKVTK